jgi:hypothetical protein
MMIKFKFIAIRLKYVAITLNVIKASKTNQKI